MFQMRNVLTFQWIAAVLGGCYAAAVAVGFIRVRLAVPLLAQDASPALWDWPLVSVIIPACNEAPSLPGAMRSLLEQNYPNLEIILVNDRSTDGTDRIVE